MKQQTAITLAAVQEAIGYVSPAERGTRVRIGEALKDEYGDAAFETWDAWYQRHDRYTASESKSAWKSFGKGGGKRCTIATLVYEAKRSGWRQTSSHTLQRTAEEAAKHEADRKARRDALAAEEAATHARAAERASKAWAAATPCDSHPYLERKGVKSHGLRFAKTWIKEWVDTDGEVHEFRHADALLVPIWSGPGKLASLQAIFPSKCIGRKPRDGEKDERRDKDYLTDGRKAGCYFSIGTIKPDTAVILVCEGYATGASLHEATGHPAMVAFDAGNLGEVAAMLRDKLPGAKLVICADNDAWTTRSDGKKWNPGVEAAKVAAKDCGGVVAVPAFADVSGRPTDFNDLHAQSGLEAVKAQIAAAVNPPPKPEKKPAENKDGVSDDELETNSYFTVLGYDHEQYFIFQHEKRQIIVATKGDFGDIGLIELAPLNWWEEHFPGGEQGGVNKKMAANWIIRLAARRGIYDISRMRGRGAWQDDGRMVYHHGSHLSVDGQHTDVTRIVSRYVYELDKSLPEPADEPMSGDEGELLLDIAGRFRWTTPGSAALLAGWVALAPLCGALRWRPHIWLTGGAGCGKSTVLNDFVHFLMGGCDVFAQGNSSEAGIRQTLKADALPVLFDESEQNNEREAARIQGVLALIRQSSTESQARTLKGSSGGDAMAFHVRSMFCLASIQVGLQHQADVERLAVLALRPKREDNDAAATWDRIKSGLIELRRDEKLPARLLRRSLDLLPVTIKNISVFSEAATKAFGSVRDGDQYGTLLAGAWSLTSTVVATLEDAEKLIAQYDWSEHRDSTDTDESELALGALMGSMIRLPGGAEVNVHELVRSAMGYKTSGVDLNMDASDAILQRHGMRADGRKLLLSNSSLELRRLMQGTPFEADLRGLLLRLPGAERCPTARFAGIPSRGISIPIADIVGVTQEAAGEQSF